MRSNFQSRKLIAGTLSSAMIGASYIAIHWMPELKDSFQTLCTAIVTVYGTYSASNVVQKKVAPAKKDSPEE